jgi:hypothetical protein
MKQHYQKLHLSNVYIISVFYDFQEAKMYLNFVREFDHVTSQSKKFLI